MSVLPDKLFVNIYPAAIGPCIGSAYATRADADRYAYSHRVACLETGAMLPNAIVVSDTCLASLQALAKQTGREIPWLIENAIAVHRAIPNEIRELLHRYADEQKISYATAVAECCRAYLTEAAR